MKNNVDKAIETFVSGCWKKVDDYYKEAVCGKNVYIYGSGVYGKFLYNALSHLGYLNQIVCFINDYVTSDNEVLFNLPVKKSTNIVFNDNDIIIVGIQNCPGVIEKLKKEGFNYLVADSDQAFYQDNLMYSFYKCIEASTIADMVHKIKLYYSGHLGNEDDVLALYDEELSKEIIRNRLNFYKTGDVSYIDRTPVSHNEYFCSDYYTITDEECFVDCGAFDGDSIKQFVEFTKGRYKKIIGLEPDTISFEKLHESTQMNHDVKVICCATGKENTQVCFASKGVLGSTFSKDGNGDLTDVKKLDDILGNENVSFIKMDIEGAELDSLIGARNTIINKKEASAVSVEGLGGV